MFSYIIIRKEIEACMKIVMKLLYDFSSKNPSFIYFKPEKAENNMKYRTILKN